MQRERHSNEMTVFQALSFTLALILIALPAFAGEGSVVFENLAAIEGSGLQYERTPSQNHAIWLDIIEGGALSFPTMANSPFKWRGAPGVAIFDHDNDGDLDIYAPNGPGSDNSLFSNQLAESGRVSFIDVGAAAGVGAVDQDSSGVCYGDIDNDGDEDLFVLSTFGSNRLFENNGDGTFTDISIMSGFGLASDTSVSCSVGDIDGDGLLDVFVGNAYYNMSNLLGLGRFVAFDLNVPNQLFKNLGGNVFADVSESSGIRDLAGFPEENAGAASLTWAVAMVDYDLDGDLDILHADDQGGVPRAGTAPDGVDRGYVHILENDGTGQFDDVTVELGMAHAGEWMGLSFGDLNQDGRLDLFATCLGDWISTTTTVLDPVYAPGPPYQLGSSSSRWFLGGDGILVDPGVGDLVATPFGWGTAMFDYDNDGDLDVVFYGSMAFGPALGVDNPGVILENDGNANFTWAAEANAATDHQRREVQGLAVGDLNDDGFTDIVSVSSQDIQESIPLATYNVEWGSPFDGQVKYQATFSPTETPGFWQYSGYEDNVGGSLAVELASPNRNRFIKVMPRGSVGEASGGKVNRSGIGAVVGVSTRESSTLRPVVGGASYASQDARELVFGLGRERRAQVDVLWPGGVRNRLYGVRAGERLEFPEIPCSYDGEWRHLGEYTVCVKSSLKELRRAGTIDRRQEARFFVSAIGAFLDEQF